LAGLANFPRENTETALTHIIGDKAEQAYRRSDALEKRRKLIEAWAAYCEPRALAPPLSFQPPTRLGTIRRNANQIRLQTSLKTEHRPIQHHCQLDWISHRA
jgi:hypothetical protein